MEMKMPDSSDERRLFAHVIAERREFDLDHLRAVPEQFQRGDRRSHGAAAHVEDDDAAEQILATIRRPTHLAADATGIESP
jgi:hypothetical protein